MSIIWIDNALISRTDKNLEFTDSKLLIYINTISVISCLIFAYFYKVNIQLQKFPSNY
jgi:hypothetical protein